MAIDPTLRDQKRLQAYAQILGEIGLPVTALDGKAPNDRAVAIRGAVDALIDERREDEKLLNLPTVVRMGDKDIEIRELPYARNVEWCRLCAQMVRDAEKSRPAPTDEIAAADLFDSMLDGQLTQWKLAAAYLGCDPPEGTTASQLNRAVEVMRHKAFPLLSQLEGISETLAARMKAQGPSDNASPGLSAPGTLTPSP